MSLQEIILAMAAYLAEVKKSRILLPREEEEDEISDDPKAELIRRLQEYKRFKEASEKFRCYSKNR